MLLEKAAGIGFDCAGYRSCVLPRRRRDTGIARGANKGEVGSSSRSRAPPWHVKEYLSKKRERQTDRLGNFVLLEESSVMAEPVGWTASSKLVLKCEIMAELEIAKQGNLDSAALLRRAQTLGKLVPDMKHALETMKADVLCRFLLDMQDVSERLLKLKQIFPYMNVSFVVTRNLFLLTEDFDVVVSGIEEVKAMLEKNGFQDEEAKRLFDQSPEMIDSKLFKQVFSQTRHLFSGKDPKSIILSNPDIALGMQNLEHQQRGNYEL